MAKQIRSTYTGEVGIDFRVVDGVVDNGVDYENWNGLGDVTFSLNGIRLVETSPQPESASLLVDYLKPSTQYTVVLKPIDGNTDNRRVWIIRSDSSVSSVFNGANTDEKTDSGEIRVLETTVSDVAGKEIRFNLFGETVGQYEEFKVSIYEGDYVTGSPPLPTSQALVVGNSVILNDTYGDVTTTDNNEVLWDKTNLVNKVVPVENINYHNQFFINADETRISFYDSELTEPCLSKALNLMKL